MGQRRLNWDLVILGASAILMIAALYLIFLWVPTDKEQGIVQRIFYFHVPSAWIGFLAFFVVFVASILYLWKRDERWDLVAHSSAEIGVIFTTLVLISGPIWAKPIWFVWWTWDARLTTELILWFIYVAYLLVRSYSELSQAPRFAAVVGIVGFIDVPIAFMAIRWWRTQHPQPVFGGGAGAGLAPSMLLTFMVSLVAFTLFYILLLRLRVALRQAESEVAQLQDRLRR